MSKGAQVQHPDYDKMLPIWQKCIDCADGEDAVHEAGTIYLPKLSEETVEEYAARKGRTPFFNATWRTISGLKGMIFRKDPEIEVPAGIIDYLKDADMAGNTLDQLAQEITQEVLTTNRCGLLVDYPSTEGADSLTVAQAAAMGLRPMMAVYPAKSITNWKTGRLGNRLVLTLVTLCEMAEIGGEFEHKSEKRYRVLDLVNTPDGARYRQRVFRVDDKGNDEQVGGDILPAIGSKPIREIPFYIFGADNMRAEVSLPPLLDLVNMNLKHYTVSADYEHGCHFSGLPTAVISGYRGKDGETLRIGGTAIITLDDPNATAAYMEVQGDFEALFKNLESKKSEMAVLGARMLENQKAAVESGDTIKQRQSGEQSQLSAMAAVISMGIEKALQVFAAWAGVSGAIRYQLNRDYTPSGITAEELTALVAAWQAGGISQQTLYRNLKAGEMYDSDDTFEAEQERINSEAPRGLGVE